MEASRGDPILGRSLRELAELGLPEAGGHGHGPVLDRGPGGCLWLGPLCVKAMRPAPDQIIDYYQDWGSARNHLAGLPVYTEHAMSIPRHLGIPNDPGKASITTRTRRLRC